MSTQVCCVSAGKVFTGCFRRRHPRTLPRTLTSTPSTPPRGTRTSTLHLSGLIRSEQRLSNRICFLSSPTVDRSSGVILMLLTFRCATSTCERALAPAPWSAPLPYDGPSTSADEVSAAERIPRADSVLFVTPRGCLFFFSLSARGKA